METEIWNHAGDTTIYGCGKTLKSVIVRLENDLSIVIQWFGGNFIKLNTDKCHLLILRSNSNQQDILDIRGSVIKNNEDESYWALRSIKNLLLTHISLIL